MTNEIKKPTCATCGQDTPNFYYRNCFRCRAKWRAAKHAAGQHTPAHIRNAAPELLDALKEIRAILKCRSYMDGTAAGIKGHDRLILITIAEQAINKAENNDTL